MLGRVAPQSQEEKEAIEAAGIDMRRILTCNELVTSQEIFFAATGITPGTLLDGVEYHGNQAKTHSLVIRGETGTRRMIHTDYGQFSKVIDTIGNST
jgi:fructose-1,6-bisphosphatase II